MATMKAEDRESSAGASPISRRDVLSSALGLSAATLASSALPTAALAQAPGAGPATGALPVKTGPNPGAWVVLLGTRGGPGIDLAHPQTSAAVVVDGRPYLVDCGYGALRQLVASNVGFQQINTVFFTHLHNDHTGDFASLLSYQWTSGKSTPTDAYGPYGTGKLVEGALAFFRANLEIRTTDEGRTVDADKIFHGHDITASATPVPVFKDDRVTVTAAENTHYPERSKAKMPHRSLALRFETKNRTIVFSGDTTYSPNVVNLARNADLFFCEIIDATVLEQMLARAKQDAAEGVQVSIARHVAETHSSPTDVARMASEANVKTVVLYHQVPGNPGTPGYPVTSFTDAVRKGFSGEVIVGQELMVL
jgi:ribonuclease BN (tRNA processing enzyme)